MIARTESGAPGGFPRRPALAWAIVFVGGLLLAALVAPLVYAALLAGNPALRWPFSRVFNRTAMAVAVLLLVACRRAVGWPELRRRLSRGTLGERSGELLVGVVAALLALGAAIAWAFVIPELGPTLAPYRFLSAQTATALLGGLAAAAIEESFFRGLMLGSLAARSGWEVAAVASSATYSLVHLLVSDKSFAWPGYAPGVGLAYLRQAVGRQLEPASLYVLFGLFLGGLVLATIVRHTGSLALAIGLHGGWAFAFQVTRHATRPLIPIPGTSFLATHHWVASTRWAFAGLVLSGVLAFAWARIARPPAATDSPLGHGAASRQQ